MDGKRVSSCVPLSCLSGAMEGVDVHDVGTLGRHQPVGPGMPLWASACACSRDGCGGAQRCRAAALQQEQAEAATMHQHMSHIVVFSIDENDVI